MLTLTRTRRARAIMSSQTWLPSAVPIDWTAPTFSQHSLPEPTPAHTQLIHFGSLLSRFP